MDRDLEAETVEEGTSRACSRDAGLISCVLRREREVTTVDCACSIKNTQDQQRCTWHTQLRKQP